MTTQQQADRDEIVRVSRALASDPSFVLHGGGNTSITSVGVDVTGAEIPLLLVKGSGWDLATIEGEGFTPLRRERLVELLQLAELDDVTMVNELRQASLDATAPTASIEALLHEYLPGRVVLHSHADAIVALTDRDCAPGEIERVLGEGVLVLPYVMPGFPLARLVADTDLTGITAVALSNHGLFTFADDADVALARHRELVGRASAALAVTSWGDPGTRRDLEELGGAAQDIAELRRDISAAAGRPQLLRQSVSQRAAEFASRSAVAELVTRGTATPEHVIYTKRSPQVGRNVAAYVAAYEEVVERQSHRIHGDLVPIDPAPRVVLDPELGLLVAGDTAKDLDVVHDITLHTMDVIDAADRLGGYRSLSEADSFDIEFWSLEQAKLAKRIRLPLAGEVAIVTGAASGIGRATAEALLAQGCAVVAIDLRADLQLNGPADAWCAVTGDVSSVDVLQTAIETACRRFGGVDIVVAAAGIFPPSEPIVELTEPAWERAFTVNTTAVARLFRATHPFLARSPRGGRVVLISTKNVAAPGPGAAAYSVSKAAASQLARVAALEWAADRIRVNQVAPDAVFDTAIWTEELLEERAANYGLTVAEYRTRNLLRAEVSSALVADAVLAFCDGLPVTTGAQLSVDGGNDRVI